MTLPHRVLATIRRHSLVPRGGRVLVALSGGGDSVALLALLRELEGAGELVVAGVAHYHHGLRGEAADADEAFCRTIAAQAGVPIEVERGDVRSAAATHKRSVEDMARRMRYEFLERAADRVGAEAIAVGHSLDDQAETFLLRLVRGSATRGLAGIRPRAGRVIRPLLEIRRAELRACTADRGLAYQEDQTNTDPVIPRNRVRHELIPYLQREFSAGIVEVLAREAELARVDEDRLEREAIEVAASVVLSNEAGDLISVDPVRLGALDLAVASRVARRVLEAGSGGRFVGSDHVARFLDWVRGARIGQAISLPGQQAARHGENVVFRREPVRRQKRGVKEDAGAVPTPLMVPGQVRIGGWVLSSDGGQGAEDGARNAETSAALIRVDGTLAVRFRRPGDRFEAPGLGGRHKKLQDYLVDRKVPRFERDGLPLVIDESDRIVWVVGHGIAHGCHARSAGPGVILLKAKRLGGEV